MYDFVVDYSSSLVQYGTLIIYALMLTLGFTQICLWLLNKIIVRLGIAKDMLKAYQEYLKSNNKNIRGG